MICPACKLENPADAAECIRCGQPLSQSAPDANNAVNQVWNTDIDREQNRKNSRTALMVLGVAAVLVLALIIAIFTSLSTLSDTLIGERAPGQSFTDRLGEFWEFVEDSFLSSHEPAPEPGRFAAPQNEAEEEFLSLVENLLKDDYNSDYDQQLNVAGKYLPKFMDIDTNALSDDSLQLLSSVLITALEEIDSSIARNEDGDGEYIENWLSWLTGRVYLCEATEILYEKYGILYQKSYIPEYYIMMLPIHTAELSVENDLTNQLSGISLQWSDEYSAYYCTYQNHTIYDLDITFYADYITEDDYTYEEHPISGLISQESLDIILTEVPEDVIECTLDWVVDDYYLNGKSIFD